jgi:hypothetical protein
MNHSVLDSAQCEQFIASLELTIDMKLEHETASSDAICRCFQRDLATKSSQPHVTSLVHVAACNLLKECPVSLTWLIIHV